ncbi:MAG: hypothetical protein OQJ77_05315 [Thiovulaceae bacterium]|nr:hypothetical protein [Sulfurimonadaceae bacterium]MCW9026716.1 hypothetical protein [Sulfurimonadaceae bacterium]
MMKNIFKIFVMTLLLTSYLGANSEEIKGELICNEDVEFYEYCDKLKANFYEKKNDMDSILYMTDSLDYLSDTRNRLSRDLADKIFLVMSDISKTIKIATNEVRKEKYKALGMVVLPVKFGSANKLNYRKKATMARGKLKAQITDFYKSYRKHDDEFLTDLLTMNGSTFVVLPEIVQYGELKNALYETKEAELQIAIDGFFGIEKGMSESVVLLGLKIDKNGKIRRLNDRKAEYEMIKKAIIELIDNALGDIASQEE